MPNGKRGGRAPSFGRPVRGATCTVLRRSDEAALFLRGLHQPGEQRMRREGFRLQLRMELHADEPGVILHLDDLGQPAIGRHAREHQPAGLQLVAILDVDLVAVAVAFLDLRGAIDLGDLRAFLQDRGIGAKPHRAALVVIELALDPVVALHPFLQVIDDGGEALLAGLVVEFLRARVGHAGEVARCLDHRHLHAKADAEIGDALFARILRGADLAFGAALAEAAGHQDRVELFKMRAGVFALEDLGVDPFGLHPHPVRHAAVGQRLSDRLVGVLELHVFADDRHPDHALGIGQPVHHVFPAGHVGLRRGRDAEGVEHRLVETDAVIGERRLVDRLQVIGRDHRIGANVAKERDLRPLLVRDRVFGPAHQHVGLDPDRAQLLHRVLRGLRLQLARGGKIGQQRQVHEDALAARAVLGELPDRLEEGQALDVADRATDLAQHEIDFLVADGDEILDLVRHVRDHLDRLAEIGALALLLEHVRVDPPRGHGIGLARAHPGEALVMAEVEVGLGAVIGDEDLAMLEGRHRARIDVEIGVELAQPHREAARLQQRAQCRGGKALAER
ncbi:hypothetical protein SDC9_30441 [bioreactor metagenome]|uniref:NAD-specific glutamate dehydrogenase n=1 Tax=bioreactor metagenome TaxID=1076179 RepID=A0A644UZH6_9ZZZZ